MTPHSLAHPNREEGCPQCAEAAKGATPADARKVPVAYEEVALPEEAAELLEKQRTERARKQASKLRRVSEGDPGASRP